MGKELASTSSSYTQHEEAGDQVYTREIVTYSSLAKMYIRRGEQKLNMTILS